VAGVLGAVAGMLGTIQAAEAIKYITGAGTLLTDTLLTFDAASMNFRKVPLKKRSDCPVCGKNPTILSLEQEHAQAA
jgi:adenylyltransferase/sulfurtransferase